MVYAIPGIYFRRREGAMIQMQELSKEENEVKRYPLIAFAIFSCPAIVYSLTGDITLSLFCIVLAVTAYTDFCTRWIPDIAIYILLAISIFEAGPREDITSLFGCAFFVLPAFLLNAYGLLVKNKVWIASGDFYIFPSVGLMVLPEHASALMIFTLLITSILNQWIRAVPLITVLYVIFSGYLLCVKSGFL